jgi:hypothetical protein
VLVVEKQNAYDFTPTEMNLAPPGRIVFERHNKLVYQLDRPMTTEVAQPMILPMDSPVWY